MPFVYLILVIVLAWALGYLLFVVPTRWLKVEHVSIPLGLGVKIFQISDLHMERNRIRWYQVKEKIEQEKPDLLCLTGDFLDTQSSLLRLVPVLRLLQSTGVPMYAVFGNHDYRLANVGSLKELLEEYGVRVLRNETVHLPSFQLVGVDDFCTEHHDETAFDTVQRGTPVIVMTHDPTVVLEMKHSFDYLFAGHLHGKQFNIPWLFRWMDMGPLAASGVYQGLHECPLGLFYISKGIGQSGVNYRFFVRSEVTMHHL